MRWSDGVGLGEESEAADRVGAGSASSFRSVVLDSWWPFYFKRIGRPGLIQLTSRQLYGLIEQFPVTYWWSQDWERREKRWLSYMRVVAFGGRPNLDPRAKKEVKPAVFPLSRNTTCAKSALTDGITVTTWYLHYFFKPQPQLTGLLSTNQYAEKWRHKLNVFQHRLD